MYPARLQSNRLPPLTCFLHRLRTTTELAASRWVAMVLLPALVGDSEYAPFLSYLSYFQLFHWEGSGQWLPCVERAAGQLEVVLSCGLPGSPAQHQDRCGGTENMGKLSALVQARSACLEGVQPAQEIAPSLLLPQGKKSLSSTVFLSFAKQLRKQPTF